MTKTSFRLTGSGGQGLILAGIILAEAAISEEKIAIQSQSYGPEARGGASKAEVIISDETIDFPKVTTPDFVLALTQKAFDKYGEGLAEDGILLVDDTIDIGAYDKSKVVSVPILQTAKEDVGKIIVANIVALGAILKLTGVVSEEALLGAILARVPKGTEKLNRAALEAGYNLVG